MATHICNTLSEASTKGHHTCLISLIQRGADVNERHYATWTPLHNACAKGHNDCVISLLNHGANIDVKDLRHFISLPLVVMIIVLSPY